MKTRALFTCLCLAAMLLAEGTVKAVLMEHDLILTENSPTSLTATFDGSPVTVTNTGVDTWIVTLTATTIITGGGSIQGIWMEPDNSGLFNTTQNLSDSTSVLVSSDALIPPPLPSETPGTPAPDGAAEFVGRTADGLRLNETFNDLAATAEGVSVPDAGSTAMLLGLALLAMEGLRRRFRTA